MYVRLQKVQRVKMRNFVMSSENTGVLRGIVNGKMPFVGASFVFSKETLRDPHIMQVALDSIGEGLVEAILQGDDEGGKYVIEREGSATEKAVFRKIG